MTEQEFRLAMTDRHLTPDHLVRLVEDVYCRGFNAGRYSAEFLQLHGV